MEVVVCTKFDIYVHVRFDILLTWGKDLHDRIISLREED